MGDAAFLATKLHDDSWLPPAGGDGVLANAGVDVLFCVAYA